ncbi:MAG: efflux RND transporter periplasmic adaptor subunit [Pseudomonadota bacterium]
MTASYFSRACCLIVLLLQTGGMQVYAADESLDCVISPRATIKLGSPEEGILEKMLVNRGDRVKQGDPVATLEKEVEELSTELARLRSRSTAEIRSARAQVGFRKKEVERLEEMHLSKTISEKVYDQAEIESQLAAFSLESVNMEHKLAQVEYRRAKARLDRRTVKSPVDGVIVAVTMSPGEYVHEQAPLMTIAEVDPLNVEVFMPVALYGEVNVGMQADIIPEEPVGGVYHADVTVVDSVFDAASRTFGVRLELPNPEYVLPAGLRCTVSFNPGKAPQTDEDLGFSVTD